jgi:adhesin transport system outer membrane protein
MRDIVLVSPGWCRLAACVRAMRAAARVAGVLMVLPAVAFAGEPASTVKDSKEILKALAPATVDTRSLGVAPRRIALQIQFELNSARLRPEASTQLDELWKAVSDPQMHDMHLEVSGHTDATGADEYNQILSEQRARVVRDFLLQKGGSLKRELLEARGFGETHLLPDLPPEAPQHRRVEIQVVE